MSECMVSSGALRQVAGLGGLGVAGQLLLLQLLHLEHAVVVWRLVLPHHHGGGGAALHRGLQI